MKRLLPSLTILIVIGSTVLSQTNAWGAQAPRVYNWGYPWGDPYGLQYYGSTLVDGIPGTTVQISTSNSASYALTKNGEVWAWGVGRGGFLGNGAEPKSTITPVEVKYPSGVKIASLPSPMPFDTGMAIDSSGNIWGWGANVESSLCVQKGNLLSPVELPLTHVTQASGAGGHALYLSDGKLFACGANSSGELGDGPMISSANPVRVVGLPEESIRSIGSSWENSGAVMADGSYYDWARPWINSATAPPRTVTPLSGYPSQRRFDGSPWAAVPREWPDGGHTHERIRVVLGPGPIWAARQRRRVEQLWSRRG